MNWIAGRLTVSAVSMSRSASSVSGFSNRSFAAFSASSRFSFSSTVLGRIGVPTLKALLIGGSERGSSATAGRSRWERSVKSA